MKKTFYFSMTESTVDAATGVIGSVSIITAGVEALGHGFWTDDTTLAQVKVAAEKYGTEGVQVKMDHWSGIGSIVGAIKNFRVGLTRAGQKALLGDITLLKEHEGFAKIIELAQTLPKNFGLSVAIMGAPEEIEKVYYVRCEELSSVDLVDDPAANPGGLFSANQERANQLAAPVRILTAWASIHAPNRTPAPTIEVLRTSLLAAASKQKLTLESSDTQRRQSLCAINAGVFHQIWKV